MWQSERETFLKCIFWNFKRSANFVVLSIKGKWLLRRLVLVLRGSYCCARYQAKRWLQQMIIALCPNDFPSKCTKAKQSTGVETNTFTMNLQRTSQKVRHFEMIYLSNIHSLSANRITYLTFRQLLLVRTLATSIVIDNEYFTSCEHHLYHWLYLRELMYFWNPV